MDGARPSTEEELRKGRVATKTWISNDQIKAVLAGMKARHVLLVSDSCYSGYFLRAMTEVTPATDEYVKAALLRTSRHALTSGGLHPVKDDGFHRQSVFTHFFLKAPRDRIAREEAARRRGPQRRRRRLPQRGKRGMPGVEPREARVPKPPAL